MTIVVKVRLGGYSLPARLADEKARLAAVVGANESDYEHLDYQGRAPLLIHQQEIEEDLA